MRNLVIKQIDELMQVVSGFDHFYDKLEVMSNAELLSLYTEMVVEYYG